MRISSPLFVSLAVCALVPCGLPAGADVTVVMRGGYSSTPGVPIPPKLDNILNSITNFTLYYRGNSVRYDSNEISEICNYSKNVVMTINNERHVYFITKRGAEQRKAVDQLFDLHGGDISIRNVRKTVKNVRYYGHQCVKLTVTETLHDKVRDIDMSFKSDEIDAVDIKGFPHPRTPDGKLAEHGITLKADIELDIAGRELIAQTQAVSISSAPLSASTFSVGKDYSIASREVVVGSGDGGSAIQIPTGLLSARAVDPNAGLNDSSGFAKARALVHAGRFDDAAAVARSLAARGMNGKLGPIYLALARNADANGKTDEAWGWYSFVLSTDNDPGDLVAAHRGIAAYYAGIKDIRDAKKQLAAVLAMPNASQADKDSAAAQLKQLTN